MNFVKVCPLCRSRITSSSESVTKIDTNVAKVTTGTKDYYCKACGRSFPPFMAMEIDETMAK